MSTHPYIPLYVDDFEAATAHLTPEEDGIYNRLLRLCWRTPGCSLPNEPAWIARKIRLSATDYERVAVPVIEEFFRAQRGRLIQKRLKAEYDNISRKKSARANAGKKGGDAKALKSQEKVPSNASDLPAHTGAFPEPEPEPVEKEAIASSAASATPSATGGLFEAEVLAEPDQPKAKPDRWASDQEFAALWQGATDQMRRRSLAKAKLWPIWREAKAKAGGGVALVAAMARYRAGDPDVGRTGGPGIDRWLRDGVWEHWLGQAETQAPTTTWPGPPQLRAAIVAAAGEDVARGYLDPATWDGPARAVVVRNAFMAERLRREAGPTLDRLNVKITVAEGVAA